MSALRQLAPITWEEYHAQDEASPVKLEFIRGEIVAMAGSSPNHALITANIIIAVGNRLRGRACYPTSSGQRIKAENSTDGYYPDVTVVCSPARFDERDNRTLLNPIVVFEVLSPSTLEIDLITKSDAYFQISSLTTYVLISQDRIRVEIRTRGEAAWNTQVLRQLTDQIELPEIGVSIPLSEIYERLEVPADLHIVQENAAQT